MSMTPASSTIPYITVQEYLLRRDVRSVYQFCTANDQDPLLGGGGGNATSSPIAMAAALADPTTPQGAILAELLGEASGMLESAIYRSKIYQLADIQALLAQGGNSARYLKRIVASLTTYSLMTRRPGPEPPDVIKESYDEAKTALNDLSIGTRIFTFAETAAAGLPVGAQITPTILRGDGFITQMYTPLFGTRAINQRYWLGVGGGNAGMPGLYGDS